MLTGSELGAAIEAARIKKNVSKKAFGDAFGIKPPSVQGWVKTGRIDKSKLIEVIRYFSDVVGPEHWGLASDDAELLNLESLPDAPTAPAESSADQVIKMLSRAGKLTPEGRQAILSAVDEVSDKPAVSNVITADFSRPSLVGDEIRIAHYDVQGAMGGGKLVHDYPEMFRDVTVSQKQLRDLGVTYKDPAHLKIISGDGQSMSPIIQHLDPMISDVSIREYTGDGIYAFTWQGHFYIKSLQIADEDHFLMVSANEALYPPKKIRIDDTYIQARILLVWKATRV